MQRNLLIGDLNSLYPSNSKFRRPLTSTLSPMVNLVTYYDRVIGMVLYSFLTFHISDISRVMGVEAHRGWHFYLLDAFNYLLNIGI